MATSSIFHNFVLTDKESIEKFLDALEKPKFQEPDVKCTTVTGIEEVKKLTEKWKNRNKGVTNTNGSKMD
jgi:hypothetical protein|uniref:hypothetical protein n=1 Tax=Eubacterium cellulosolvens TaxID=29322 RepID=UPI00055670E5|nr:hypothetical protein [[Eubacterium] cellulosolvens]